MIKLNFTQGSQEIFIEDDRLYGNTIRLVVPEWFCASDRQFTVGDMKPRWEIDGDHHAVGTLESEDGSKALFDVSADDESITVDITLSNNSAEEWKNVSDFCCWSYSPAPEFADYEMLRTYVWQGGRRKRVIELERPKTVRPLFMFYPVKDRARLEATQPLREKEAMCSETLDHGAIAVTSRDEMITALLTSEETLFVFNNAEYACVHSCPCYGTIAPGESATRRTRLLLHDGDVDEAMGRVG